MTLKSVWWELSCSVWSDGRKDMKTLIVSFRNFAKASKTFNTQNKSIEGIIIFFS